MAFCVTICSGKGGVGKSTFASLLSLALARDKKRTLLLDADLGLNNLDIILGILDKKPRDLYDVLQEEIDISEAIVSVRDCLHFATITSKTELLTLHLDRLKNLIAKIAEDYDYLIIDSPAGIEKGFSFSLELSNLALIVTNVETASLRDAFKVRSLIKREHYQDILFVLNRCSFLEGMNNGLIDIDSELFFRLKKVRDPRRFFSDDSLQRLLSRRLEEIEKVKV